MPAEMKYEDTGLWVLRVSGTLKRSEFGAEQKALAAHIDTGSKLAFARAS